MSELNIEALEKAGKVATDVLTFAKDFVKPGMKVLDICEELEKRILSEASGMSFPVNVSINEIAAHYTSPENDDTVVPENSIVKIDLGAHVDGRISDAAISVAFNDEYYKLIEVVRDAVELAVSMIRPGVETGKIGEEVYKFVRSKGLITLRDLQGHQIERRKLHAGKTIPSVPYPFSDRIEEGEIYAVEIFVTTGSGSIHEDVTKKYIYSLNESYRARPRLKISRKVLSHVRSAYKTLPFARRRVVKALGGTAILGLKELNDIGILRDYPPLIENTKAPVAQREVSVIVESDGAKVYAGLL